MLNLQSFIASVLGCMGWPYKSPGTNDQYGIDCSGLLVKAFADQGEHIYHGSNTIYRKYCSKVGKIYSEKDLKQGMVVFKWKEKDTAKYPDGLGDFCHIGVVTSTNPLVITHASSDAGCVTQDKKIGKWKYWGMLKDMIYPDGTTMYDPAQIEDDDEPDGKYDGGESATPDEDAYEIMVVWSENGKPVKMRQKPSTNCKLWDNVPCGTEVELVTYGDTWSQINYGKRKGWYMMSKFLRYFERKG